MAFDGYYQILCERGHQAKLNAAVSPAIFSMWHCDAAGCREHIAWWNLVDVTYGTHDADGKRIDGYLELKEKDPAQGTFEMPESGGEVVFGLHGCAGIPSDRKSARDRMFRTVWRAKERLLRYALQEMASAKGYTYPVDVRARPGHKEPHLEVTFVDARRLAIPVSVLGVPVRVVASIATEPPRADKPEDLVFAPETMTTP